MRLDELRSRIDAALESVSAPSWGAPAHLPPGTRVVVALSGGVDSSVAAGLLRAVGYDVIGVSMRLAPERERADGHRGCCSLDDFDDARQVAARLGIPHYVIDLRRVFARAVVDPFTKTYLAGQTPNPCVLCNRDVKFGELWEYAATWEARAVATGHYARIVCSTDEEGFEQFQLHAARDAVKDQSYFLFHLGPDDLARTLFPLGGLDKPAVRALATALELPVAEKPESQDICFVAGRSYEDVIEEAISPDQLRPGRILDADGATLGLHGGVHRFTVGQRRGLGGGAAEPRYVISIDPEGGDVRVGTRADLARRSFHVRDVSWAGPPAYGPARVRLRHRHRGAGCTITRDERGTRVLLDEPTVGVTPGQAAVWYDGDRVLGGGWITPAGEGS